MARKPSTSPPKPPLELKAHADDVRAKIQVQIDKGRELVTGLNSLRTPDQLEGAQRQYSTWNAYNAQLLKQLFTSDELAEEYNRYHGGIIVLRERSLGEKLQEHRDDIEGKIGRLESIMARVELLPLSAAVSRSTLPEPPPLERPRDKTQVLIVHGHDEAVKQEVARFIEKLGFKPIILHEQPSRGRTVIEKIEHYAAQVGFGVVLYTPCDVGSEKALVMTTQKPRARQNVVLEHGYLLSEIGRENVVALLKSSDIERPSDVDGVIYVSMETDWKSELARELKHSGYNVDFNKVLT